MRLRLFLLVGLAACSGKAAPAKVATDSLTTRQRDSAIGASGLPGATGVQKAMNAVDSGDARTARIDSIGADIN
ncbi:MAG: hypothetical protein ABI679_03755 [Gemmatimonadota bacterium]